MKHFKVARLVVVKVNMILRNKMVEKEIASFLKESNDIEGHVFSIDDYVEDSENPYIKGQIDAFNFIINHLRIAPISDIDNEIIFTLYELLTKNTPEVKEKNIKMWQYRDRNVQVGGRLCPEPFLATELMNNWILDFNSMKHDPLEIHYRFELIHPMTDFNGRLGRDLLIYDLIRRGLPVKNMLDNFKGETFFEKRNNYYRAIDNFNNKNRQL